MTEPRRFEPPDVRQILIPPGLWDVTEQFFRHLGYDLGPVPGLEDPTPTYFLALNSPEAIRAARRRAADAIREGNTRTETEPT